MVISKVFAFTTQSITQHGDQDIRFKLDYQRNNKDLNALKSWEPNQHMIVTFVVTDNSYTTQFMIIKKFILNAVRNLGKVTRLNPHKQDADFVRSRRLQAQLCEHMHKTNLLHVVDAFSMLVFWLLLLHSSLLPMSILSVLYGYRDQLISTFLSTLQYSYT